MPEALIKWVQQDKNRPTPTIQIRIRMGYIALSGYQKCIYKNSKGYESCWSSARRLGEPGDQDISTVRSNAKKGCYQHAEHYPRYPLNCCFVWSMLFILISVWHTPSILLNLVAKYSIKAGYQTTWKAALQKATCTSKIRAVFCWVLMTQGTPDIKQAYSLCQSNCWIQS